VRAPRFAGRAEKGIIVIITLIALVVLLLSSIALVRSFTNSNLVSGAVAIKRDMVNQAQRGLVLASQTFQQNILLSAIANRNQAVPQFNYSPCILPTDAYGIPIIIEDSDANLTATTDLDGNNDPACASTAISAGVGNDIATPEDNNTVGIRYVIDRLCLTTAAPSAATCVVSNLGAATDGTQQWKRPKGIAAPVYRITVRVKVGNLTSYVQGTYS
jgi:hypothetical protein